MKMIVLFLLLLCESKAFCQRDSSVSFNVSIGVIKDGLQYYNVSIHNKSDSVVCILHSIFADLSRDSVQGLAVYGRNKLGVTYILNRTFEDTSYIAEAAPRKGTFILPGQYLRFEIATDNQDTRLTKAVIYQYFFVDDFCFDVLKKEMRAHPGSWYLRYKKSQDSIKM